ncbi:MAG: kynureninase [Parasphingorhabdus sp.]|jgi:kynureninase
MITQADIKRLDDTDPIGSYRDLFDLPESVIYLDGNSLGALPRSVAPAIEQLIHSEWRKDLIKSWNVHNWIDLPVSVGEKIAPIIGAGKGQVICADSTSVNLYKLLISALRLRNDRTEILSTSDNFPTDLYLAEAAVEIFGDGTKTLRCVDSSDLFNSINQNTAVLLLTQVNFRDGSYCDIKALTQAAHDVGALVIWDLSHSAGVMPLSLDDDNVDFAVGCGYKYLNGGPGAPSFLYINKNRQNQVNQPLSGWLGHESPFNFDKSYRPAPGVLQYQCGTPGLLSMRALDAALDVYHNLDINLNRQKSMALTDLFVSLIDSSNLGFELISSRASSNRGSQVSYLHDQGYAIIQALISRGVIGDYRDPKIMRFRFAPLYNSYKDVFDAVEILNEIMRDKTYLRSEHQLRKGVT